METFGLFSKLPHCRSVASHAFLPSSPQTMEALKPCLTKPENVRAVCLTLLDVRKAYFLRIVERDEKQGKFLKGWMNRLKKLRGYVDEAA